MSKIRIRFSREEQLKFISHLDMLKLFERAIRRAHIPITYTQGFNPHAKMEFALPLAVGITSEAEYADFEVEGDYSPIDFKNNLNDTLPDGIFIYEALKTEGNKSLMSLVGTASYIISILSEMKPEPYQVNLIIEELMRSADITVSKSTKSGVKKINIRPMIYKLYFCNNSSLNNGYVYRLGAILSSGSQQNLSPAILAELLVERFGGNAKLLKIHRTGLYTDKQAKIRLIDL